MVKFSFLLDKQCELNETRYYYDGTSFSCKKFIYSGCFGNNNNFHTMEECERRCQVPLLFGNLYCYLKSYKFF